MSGQFYCPQIGKFLPCEEAFIGKVVSCPSCGGTHDAMPVQEEQSHGGARNIGAPTLTAPHQEASDPAEGKCRLSTGGLITAGILLLSGLSVWFTPSGPIRESRIDSIRAILIGFVFVARSFYPPMKWWQGLLTFFGGGFLVTGLIGALVTGDLARLIAGGMFAAPLLYFGFKRGGRPGKIAPQATRKYSR